MQADINNPNFYLLRTNTNEIALHSRMYQKITYLWPVLSSPRSKSLDHEKKLIKPPSYSIIFTYCCENLDAQIQDSLHSMEQKAKTGNSWYSFSHISGADPLENVLSKGKWVKWASKGWAGESACEHLVTAWYRRMIGTMTCWY